MRTKAVLSVLFLLTVLFAGAQTESASEEPLHRVFEVMGRQFEVGENFVPFPKDTVFFLRDLDGVAREMTLEEFMQSEMSYDYRYVLRLQWTWEQNKIINETGTLEEVLQNPLSQEIPERFGDQIPNYRTKGEGYENVER